MNILPDKLLVSLSEFKNRYPTLFFTLVGIILVSIFLGINQYYKNSKLNKNEIKMKSETSGETKSYYEGRVTYSSTLGDKIIYDLRDPSGNFIATLQTNDEKLRIVEGLYVRIYGTFIRGNPEENKKNILIVKEVTLQK